MPLHNSFRRAIKPWCPLSIQFDQSAVAVDLLKIDHRKWAPQAEASVDQIIRPFQCEDWSVIPLLSPNSDSNRTDPGLPGEDYGPTPLLSKLDAFESLLDSIPCEKMAARIFRLKPGASIERHIDPFFGFEYGKLRLHAPIITSESALMVFGDDSVHWSAGRLWYGDFGRVHTVTNSAAQSRFHIVIDCLINSMLLDTFPESHRPECVMLNRTIVTDSFPPAIGVGHWSVSVSAKAFDWTNSLDIEGELQVSFWVDEMTYEPFLTLPSGITAKLRPLGGNDYRIGFMPEESIVRILEDTIEIVRRVGDHLEVYSCTLKETSGKITH